MTAIKVMAQNFSSLTREQFLNINFSSLSDEDKKAYAAFLASSEDNTLASTAGKNTYSCHEYEFEEAVVLESAAMFRKRDDHKGRSWNFALTLQNNRCISASCSEALCNKLDAIFDGWEELIVPYSESGEFQTPEKGEEFAKVLNEAGITLLVDDAADSNGRYTRRSPESLKKHGGLDHVIFNYTLTLKGARYKVKENGSAQNIWKRYADYLNAALG